MAYILPNIHTDRQTWGIYEFYKFLLVQKDYRQPQELKERLSSFKNLLLWRGTMFSSAQVSIRNDWIGIWSHSICLDLIPLSFDLVFLSVKVKSPTVTNCYLYRMVEKFAPKKYAKMMKNFNHGKDCKKNNKCGLF